MKKKLDWTPPAADGKLKIDVTYLAFSSRYTNKDQARQKFHRRYGRNPEIVFFGPPNGSTVYAGPVPGSDRPSERLEIQPNLL